MNTLCFSTNLTSSELAAWVQAIGSVLAIVGAAWAAIYAARKQHSSALAVQAAERQDSRAELAKTLSVLSNNCLKAMTFLISQLKDRETVHFIAEGHVHFDLDELTRQDSAIAAIPLYNFPSSLVTPTMILGATVRQFREKVEQVLRVHRSMDATAFEDFFGVLAEMQDSLRATCTDIERETEELQRGGL